MSEYVRLDEACVLNMGQSPDSSSYNENCEGLPFFQGNADFGDMYPEVRIWCSAPTKIVEENTLLISLRAPIGALNFSNTKSCIGRGLAGLTPTEEFDLKYIYYCLKGKHAELNAKGTGSTFKAISKNALGETLVRKIDKKKQLEIVEILDKTYGVICNRKQELEQLDLLIKARFVEMFGDLADPTCKYDKCKLVDACVASDDIKCGPFGTQLSKDEYQTEGVAVWEIPQINSGFSQIPTHYVSVEKAEQLLAYSLLPGDIAMSRKGNVGRCGFFPSSFEPGIIHSDVLRIRVDSERVDPCFMMCQLHFSGDVQHQIEMVSSGAVMAGINVTKLKQIYVYLPPTDKQRQFADFVAQVDKSKVAVQKALDETQILFDSLMQKYFG